jgi:hypothetical protein
MDQALTESISRFSRELDRSRELFMGMLGHDLRTPLQVILQTTRVVSKVLGEPSAPDGRSGVSGDGGTLSTASLPRANTEQQRTA